MIESEECTIEKCDIFDFMAQHVGLSVLHPGGFEATNELATRCDFDEGKKIIDIACGKGTTSIYLAKRFGCKVIGIDFSERLIGEAKHLAKKSKVENLVSFQVADALGLPFHEGEFDGAISQAMLVLVDDKKKAIKETMRVLKEGGRAGWVELSWKKEPTKEFLDKVSNEICAYCMTNVEIYDGWKALFSEAGFNKIEVFQFPMDFQGMRGMLRDEGILNSCKVMFRYVTHARIRKRMTSLNRLFKAHLEYFGYGLYICTK
jgi:ubiquinone/menaquinone biosynthesis C-methylase UbiE